MERRGRFSSVSPSARVAGLRRAFCLLPARIPFLSLWAGSTSALHVGVRSGAWEESAKCWTQKAPKISASELPEARKAYDHAREVYEKLIEECEAE